MMDPVTFTMKVQQAAFIGACCAIGIAAAKLVRMLKGELALFDVGAAHRRAAELHAPVPVIAQGPTWSDHYGRRVHDVDVEHMR